MDAERVATDKPDSGQPDSAPSDAPAAGRPVKPGRLPVSEILYSRAGAGSPFGEEAEFPMPIADIDYELPDGHRYSDPVEK